MANLPVLKMKASWGH